MALGIQPQQDSPSSFSFHLPTRNRPSTPKAQKSRRPHWKRIATLVPIAILALIGIVFGLFKFAVWLLSPSASAFDGLLPAQCPLVVEGSKDEVLAFLGDRINTQELAGLGASNLASLDCSRLLLAVLPSNQAPQSRECQVNLMNVVNNIEDLWNKNTTYPSQLPPMPPCPAQGHLTYTSDGDSFSLTCQGPDHCSCYNSESGLQGQNFAEDDHSRFTSELSELNKDSSRSGPTYSNIEIAEENQNRGALLIGVADCPQNLASALKVKDRPRLQLLCSDSVKAKESCDGQTNKLEFAGPNDCRLRIVADSNTFSQVFPNLPLKMPNDSRTTCWQSANGAYSLRVELPSSLHQQALSIAGEPGADRLLQQLPVGASTIAGSANLMKLLSVWPENLDYPTLNKDLSPQAAGLSLISPSDPRRIFSSCLRALVGRVEADFVSQFTCQQDAQAWLKDSTWSQDVGASENNPSLAVQNQDNLVLAKFGDPGPKLSAPNLPKSPQEAKVAGWVTLQEGQQQSITSFTAGIITGKNEQKDTLWIEAQSHN